MCPVLAPVSVKISTATALDFVGKHSRDKSVSRKKTREADCGGACMRCARCARGALRASRNARYVHRGSFHFSACARASPWRAGRLVAPRLRCTGLPLVDWRPEHVTAPRCGSGRGVACTAQQRERVRLGLQRARLCRRQRAASSAARAALLRAPLRARTRISSAERGGQQRCSACCSAGASEAYA